MAAGAASFLSPCVLPLVPSFLGFLAQSGSQPPSDPSRGLDVRGRLRRRSRVVAGALGFVVGLSIILTTFFYALYRLLEPWKHVTLPVLGALVIALGLSFMGILRLPWLAREVRWLPSGFNKGGFLAGLFLGLGFGAGWTPCIGPVLGAVLTSAIDQGTTSKGMLLIVAYSVGLGLPFVLAALMLDQIRPLLRTLNRRHRLISLIGGALVVVMGVLVVTNNVTLLNGWLSSHLPIFFRDPFHL
jgi:cytochrome c-type biogenesis protein